jgi:hypothetical protein
MKNINQQLCLQLHSQLSSQLWLDHYFRSGSQLYWKLDGQLREQLHSQLSQQLKTDNI